jgi:hypothetical protein
MEFNDYKNDIKDYCARNNIDFDKISTFPRGSGRDNLMFLYLDNQNKKTLGLLDETPLPIVLMVRRKDNVLSFEQTENTKKYASL